MLRLSLARLWNQVEDLPCLGGCRWLPTVETGHGYSPLHQVRVGARLWVVGQPGRVFEYHPDVGAGQYGKRHYPEGQQTATMSDPGGLEVELSDPVGDE